MWLSQVVKGKVVLTLPEAFDILEAVLNDPRLRQELIVVAIQPGDFDWEGFGRSLGVNPENLNRFIEDWNDKDVVIQGCVDAVIIAEDQGLTLQFVPSIAETTRVDLVIRGATLQVVISSPVDLARIPNLELKKEGIST